MAFAGTSITVNNAEYSYRRRAMFDVPIQSQQYQWSFVNAAQSGHNTWSNLVRLQRDILANNPDVIVFDTANDSAQDFQNAALEAFIRRIWDAGIIILGAYNFMQVADEDVNANIDTPGNQDGIEAAEALYAHYGLRLLDYWGTIQQRVNNEGHNLNEYMGDVIHPNATGHDEAYALLSPYLPLNGLSQPNPLPARLYDDGTMENEPTIRLGNANDGESGAWSTIATTGRQSSNVGDTITFNDVTCSTLGAYRGDALSATVEISVDGGAFREFYLYQNGGALVEGLGTHDIVIRVLSDTVRIDELWAV